MDLITLGSMAPKTGSDNQFVIWTELEINRAESPIFGWERGLVMQSLEALALEHQEASKAENETQQMQAAQQGVARSSMDVAKASFDEMLLHDSDREQ